MQRMPMNVPGLLFAWQDEYTRPTFNATMLVISTGRLLTTHFDGYQAIIRNPLELRDDQPVGWSIIDLEET